MKQQDNQSVRIKIEDLKKLEKYKVHPNQPYWEVIRKIINEKGGKTK